MAATLGGCSPPPYQVGVTLRDGQLAVYAPGCGDEWVIESITIGVYGPEDYLGGWAIELLTGDGGRLFTLGHLPAGYEETDRSPQDLAFPPDAVDHIYVRVTQTRQTEQGIEETGAEASAKYLADLAEGVLIDSGGSETTVKDLERSPGGSCSGRLR